MEYTTEIKIKNSLRNFSKVSVLASFVLHVLTLIVFFGGLVVYRGRAIDISYAFELIFSIFDSFSLFGVMDTVMGALYVAALVTLIKNIIVSIKAFKLFFHYASSKHGLYSEDEHRSFLAASYRFTALFVKSFISIMEFVIFAKFLSVETAYTEAMTSTVIFIAVAYVLSKIANNSLNYYSARSTFMSLVNISILFVSLYAALHNLLIPAIERIYYNIEFLFDSGSFLEAMMMIFGACEAVFFIVFVNKLKKIFSDYNTSYFLSNSATCAKRAKGILKGTAVLIAIYFVCLLITGSFEFDALWWKLERYLPFLFATVAIMLSAKRRPYFSFSKSYYSNRFSTAVGSSDESAEAAESAEDNSKAESIPASRPAEAIPVVQAAKKPAKKKKEKKLSPAFNIEEEEYGRVDKKGILRIRSEVLAIEREAFKDQTNITEVYIPADVEIIERGAFSGCTSLRKIHCAARFQPRGWDPDWKENCYATVSYAGISQ